MRVRVSHRVDSHLFNPSYPCLIVEWLPEDLNFRIRSEAAKHIHIGEPVADWLPTDKEVLELNRHMIEISPTFLARLRALWQDLTVSKLHEVIM